MIIETIVALLAIPLWQLGLALIGGLTPVLIWLWFLEHEDTHTEPRRLTILAFLAGILAVLITIPIQGLVYSGELPIPFNVLVIWVIIEEILKFSLAATAVLWRSENDEPIDSMMYLIVTALGFAALENAFFLLKPIINDDPIQTLITGNLRFIGATLLHVVTSAIVGAGLALAFYRSKATKVAYVIIGLLLAIILHAAFNLSIMVYGGTRAIFAFYAIWAAFIAVLLLFEEAKRMQKLN